MIKQNIAQILESEMDRKDFLKTMGVAVAAFTGVTAAIKTISSHPALVSGVTQQKASTEKAGYGMLAYGGSKTGYQTATVSAQ